MGIQDITSIITVVFVIIGIPIGLYQWAYANRIKRSEYLNQIIEKLRFDKDLSKIMYLIEYSERWYDSKFHNSEHESEFDKFFLI